MCRRPPIPMRCGRIESTSLTYLARHYKSRKIPVVDYKRSLAVPLALGREVFRRLLNRGNLQPGNGRFEGEEKIAVRSELSGIAG